MNIKKILLVGLFCLSGMYSMTSQAVCYFLSGSDTDSSTINFGNVIIQRDAPIGTVVASQTDSSLRSRGDFIHCDETAYQTMRWSTEGTSSVDYNNEELFNVGIAGLAMRVVTPSVYGNFTGRFPRDFSFGGCTASIPTSWRRYCGASWGAATRFELVKIASTTGSGTLIIPGRIRAGIVNRTYAYAFNFGTSSVSTVACSVTSPAINVPMGNVKRNTFTGIGHMGDPVPFDVQLDCDAGTRVNITVNATADGANVPGVMAIDSSATGNAASGVGIQLTRASAPVRFGSLIPVGTRPTEGLMTIPFVARYYQTKATVTPGVANATATFTMTYN